jgi:hypothetical protein
MKDIRSAYTIFMGNLKKEQLEGPNIDKKMILIKKLV